MYPWSLTANYTHLVRIYCGERPSLPDELCMLCLEFAGMCGRGRRTTFFWVYC